MGFETAELDESGRIESKNFEDDYRSWFYAHAPEGVTPDDHGIDWNAWQARQWHSEEHLHPTSWTMMRALNFLQNRDMQKPFFLNISFARPHSPYVPAEPYWEMYKDGSTPPPYVGDWSSMNDFPTADPNAWRGKLTDLQVHRGRAGYYGEISFIDAQIGRLTNWMERFQGGAFSNTCIIFTSDHGDMVGDHYLWRKTYAYEGSARVPFIVVPPSGRRADRKVADEVVELRDIMPTLLDIAGVPIPKTVDGRSVANLLHTPDKDWRTYIHGEHCEAYGPSQEMQYVTDGKKKFIWLPRINVEQFFDLETDPGECKNLINVSSQQTLIAQWRKYLTEELASRDCGWVKDGKPYCPDNKPLISVYKNKRWTGA
jgi:arylsulfatase A-like enzyme